MNSNIQPYIYPQRLQEGVNGIRIRTSNLIYTWRAEKKKKGNIKKKNSITLGELENLEKKEKTLYTQEL